MPLRVRSELVELEGSKLVIRLSTGAAVAGDVSVRMRSARRANMLEVAENIILMAKFD